MSELTFNKTDIHQDIFDPSREDWRQTEPERPFTVAVSVATVGASRDVEDWQFHRVPFAGNMSENYAQPSDRELDRARINKELSDEQRALMSHAGIEHTTRFIESCGYLPGNTAVMRPQTDYSKPLGIIDVDQVFTPNSNADHATWLEDNPGDMLITRNPDVVLGCRPADCPVLVIKGKDRNKKDILVMIHAGWQGLNAGYLEEGMAHLYEQGVDFSSLQVYVGPGAQKENFPYANEHDPRGSNSSRFTHEDRESLFVDVTQDPETKKYHFSIDMFGFIEKMLIEKIGLNPEQVAFDGSDTAAQDSGYSSNTRSSRTKEVNTRDIMIASMGEPSFDNHR